MKFVNVKCAKFPSSWIGIYFSLVVECYLLELSFTSRIYLIIDSKTSLNKLVYIYKQPFNKQRAAGGQLSGLNPLSLSDNKNYRLKKSGVFA